MKFRSLGLLGLSLLFIASCKMDEPFDISPNQELQTIIAQRGGKDVYLLPDEGDLSAIPQDPKNPLTPEKIQLGKLLFHETAIGTGSMTFGGNGTFSCASCHMAGAGFQAGRFQGIGDGGNGFGFNGEGRFPRQGELPENLDVQPIRTPAALNTAYQEVMLWNGQFGATGVNRGTERSWTSGTPKESNFLGFEGVETQAIAGLGVHRLAMTPEMATELGYQQLFDAAFPQVATDTRYSTLYAGLAIAAYERSLVSNQAPFQQWLRGNPNALSTEEAAGAVLFFGKANCVNCHNGPALNSMSFAALGMSDLFECEEPTFKTSVDNVENRGRGGFTNRPEDEYKFKVPQLYNLKSSPFYGHGASFRSVREVIEYKNAAVAQNDRVPATQLSPDFTPLGLSEQEVDALTAFIEGGLHDPDLRRYQPLALPSGQCFPNNDSRSRTDVGCD